MHSLILRFSSSSFYTGSSSSAAIIDGHFDLLKEILVLLPAKSLVRFKLVSKHWQFIISSQTFTLLHLQKHCRHSDSFILGVHDRSQFFICPPALKKLVQVKLPNSNQYIEYVKILQSCKGLFFVNIKLFGYDYIFYYVFNPTTMQQRCINPVENQRDCPIKVCLIFDPSKSEYYKVVSFWETMRFSVYDSATHQWTPMTQLPPSGKAIRFSISDEVLCNLLAYFLRKGETSYYRFFYEEYNCIFPDYYNYDNYFVESNGHLHFLQLYFNQPHHFCLQIAEMVNHEWVIVDHEFLIGKKTLDFGGGTMSKVQALGMIRNETIEDSMFLFHMPGQIMIYRFSDEACEVLVDYRSGCFYEEDKLQFQYEDAHPFIHTLAYV